MSTESGMVLVPLEPSEETLQAMYKAWHAGGMYVLNTYKAAIAEQSPAHRKPQELEEVISDVRAVAQMPMLARSVKANLFIAADMLDTGFAAPASPPTPAVDGAMRESIAGCLSGLAGQRLDQMADLIMRWPLPKSVCSDPCVSMQNYTAPRYGTSLMTHGEALQMLEYVFARLLEPRQQKLGDWKGDPCSICGCWHADYPHLSCTQEKKEPK
jgi:hypothetical protein